jgi:hypothetical protein
MITWNDLPIDLVARAWDLNFDVEIASMHQECSFKLSGWMAACQPTWTGQGMITLSGSIEPKDSLEILAHEIGHAEQWREKAYYMGDDVVKLFKDEVDATERGRKYVNITSEFFWGNYLSYSELLGMEHLGRS